MSEIRANTISDAAGTGPIDLHKQSAAKSWVNFQGGYYSGTGLPVVRDSFNVTSITDNASGNHTINFTNSMDSSDYSPQTSSQFDTNFHGLSTIGEVLSGSFTVFGMTGGSAATYLGTIYKADHDITSCTLFGDLA